MATTFGTNRLVVLGTAFLLAFPVAAQGSARSSIDQTQVFDIGQYYPFLKQHAERRPKSLSWLAKAWADKAAEQKIAAQLER